MSVLPLASPSAFQALIHSSVIYHLPLDDAGSSALPPLYSTSNDFASTSSPVFASNNGCIHTSLLSIGADASPFVPESLIETYYSTPRDQKQGMDGRRFLLLDSR